MLLQKDLEAEMKRLKLELKQTMDMYNTACKEAVSAKQMVFSVRKKKKNLGAKDDKASKRSI